MWVKTVKGDLVNLTLASSIVLIEWNTAKVVAKIHGEEFEIESGLEDSRALFARIEDWLESNNSLLAKETK